MLSIGNSNHQKQWEFLKNKFETGNFSHAYLFSGQDSTVLKLFSKEFVKFISKSIAGSDLAIERGSFPDLLVVKSENSESSLKNEKDMMEIDVGQIRGVQSFLSYKSYYGGYKSVIIENADRMNTEAQSCLLKSLEEPKGKTLILLISSQSDVLLATIRSRCQLIKFTSGGVYESTSQEQQILQGLLNVIDAELAIKFLYAKNINVEGNNLNVILEVLQRYFRSLLLIKLGIIKGEVGSYSLEKIKKSVQSIESIKQQVRRTNVNAKLALEVLLMEL